MLGGLRLRATVISYTGLLCCELFEFALVNIILYTVNFIAGWVKCKESVETKMLGRMLLHWRWLKVQYLGAGEAILGPAKGVAVLVQQGVLLLDTCNFNISMGKGILQVVQFRIEQ